MTNVSLLFPIMVQLSFTENSKGVVSRSWQNERENKKTLARVESERACSLNEHAFWQNHVNQGQIDG